MTSIRLQLSLIFASFCIRGVELSASNQAHAGVQLRSHVGRNSTSLALGGLQ